MILFGGDAKVGFNHRQRGKDGHHKQSRDSVILKYLLPFRQCISAMLNEKAWLTNKSFLPL